MKMKSVAAMFLALTVFLGGCAAQAKRSTAPPPFAVKIVPTGPHYVTEGRVGRSGDGLVVAGTVRRPHEVQLPGHVVVEVLGPDGELVAWKRVVIPGLTSNRKGFMDLPFLVRLDFLPPPGSTVRLWYHGPHLDKSQG